ncbi:hypothetical protein GJ496_006893 [Pomphorhynchus laevis]|nr:hypothetical protein GJ496_006893 [Pomphorhynchus laevis]
MEIEVEIDSKILKLNLSEPIPIINVNKHKWKRRHRTLIGKPRKKHSVSAGLPKSNLQIDKELVDELNKRLMPDNYQDIIHGERVEYDLEEEDFTWLDLYGRSMGLDESSFEGIIDQLEKCAIFLNSEGAGEELVDEEAVCAVCLDDDCNNSNAILFCDRCNIPVHQDCYGVPFIPTGEWICQKCMYSPSCEQMCQLCFSSKGALKQTVDGQWVHILCILWIPELYFLNTVYLEPASSIKELSIDRQRLHCSLCSKNEGACVQCSGYHCFSAFHVTCAQSNGFLMRLKPDGTSEIFCAAHIPENVLSDSCASNVDFVEQRKRKYKSLMEKMSCGCKQSRLDPIVITTDQQKIMKIFEHQLIDPLRSFKRIYNYWKLKRFFRNGVPLIRSLQCQARTGGISKDVIYKNIITRSAIKLRQFMEIARQLCELALKRERLKYAYIFAKRNEYQLSRQSVANMIKYVIDELFKLDSKQVFHFPVTEDIAPQYSTIVKKPMCLTSMESNNYYSIEQLHKHFNLMCSNCFLYNSKTSEIYTYAFHFKNEGQNLIDRCKKSLILSTVQYAMPVCDPYIQSHSYRINSAGPLSFHSVGNIDEQTTVVRRRRKRRKWRREYYEKKKKQKRRIIKATDEIEQNTVKM